MNSKEKILSNLDNAKIKNLEIQRVDPVNHIKHNANNLVEEYITRAIENKAIVIDTKKSNLVDEINKIIEKEEASNLIYPNGLPIEIDNIRIKNKFKFCEQIETFKEHLFAYDVSIINARFGVSSHGNFCVTSSKDQPRILSLTSKLCIVLLKKENILESMSEALKRIKKEAEKLPTNILFICGPSRTSDIELQTVMGVHGSQIVYVLVY
ncbi:lactate utilization protein C [Campylobacter sp. FMV-PI01]|uniref:Lactate utilization protein C n=1 Tax=Campylobacter portucalensis TaxID=2608384 RepID=A0A6L5WKM6_9BACT|nr:lactate utilization protein C [Campylobacter portucalensis]MSN96555.1 lactate utilization protein C [Campylobacter portucalensis]